MVYTHEIITMTIFSSNITKILGTVILKTETETETPWIPKSNSIPKLCK